MLLTDFTDHQPIGLLSQHFPPDQNLHAFAHTNALLRRPVALPPVFAHFWTLSHTVILGMQDTRLPHLPQALAALGDWHYFVRNSGGLGVVADEAVLNFSLFLPADALTIPAAYQLMADLIAAALPEYSVQAGEVPRSYCPGTYDLSINGQKFAGLAQRRTTSGIAVMAYLSATGDQTTRGQLMQAFYQAGDAQAASRYHFPEVDPTVMTSLDMTVGMLQARLVHALGAATPLVGLHQPAYGQAFQAALADMQSRQEALHE